MNVTLTCGSDSADVIGLSLRKSSEREVNYAGAACKANSTQNNGITEQQNGPAEPHKNMDSTCRRWTRTRTPTRSYYQSQPCTQRHGVTDWDIWGTIERFLWVEWSPASANIDMYRDCAPPGVIHTNLTPIPTPETVRRIYLPPVRLSLYGTSATDIRALPSCHTDWEERPTNRGDPNSLLSNRSDPLCAPSGSKRKQTSLIQVISNEYDIRSGSFQVL
ncbi:hypothetical protein DFH06DRAFT_307607 [Mycena polygramma]|nr:hypothetical protein DFH06DRAFT_307607 [Mycena polygramma]